MQMLMSEEPFLVERRNRPYKMQHCRNGMMLSSIHRGCHYKLPLLSIGLLPYKLNFVIFPSFISQNRDECLMHCRQGRSFAAMTR